MTQPPTDFTPPWTIWRVVQALKGALYGQNLSIPPVDLRGKTALITGANSGIGRETALLFAAWGADVVLACRPNPPSHEPHPEAVVEECRAAAVSAGHRGNDVFIEWWACDMASTASVEALGARYLQTGRSLDILVNNAGIGQGTKAIVTADGFDLLHQINCLSHTLLTLLLLPALAKAEAPRITFSTSCMHYLTDLKFDSLVLRRYNTNKLYLQIWLTELQVRMAAHPKYNHIVAHGVHPGYVNSNIWSGVDEAARVHWVPWVLTKSLEYVAINSQQGSLAIATAATGTQFGLRADGGDFRGGARYFNRIWPQEPMPHTRSASCRKQVWEFIASELGFQDRPSLSQEIKTFAT